MTTPAAPAPEPRQLSDAEVAALLARGLKMAKPLMQYLGRYINQTDELALAGRMIDALMGAVILDCLTSGEDAICLQGGPKPAVPAVVNALFQKLVDIPTSLGGLKLKKT